MRPRAAASDPQHLVPPQQEIDPYSPSARLTVHGTHVGCARFAVDAAGARSDGVRLAADSHGLERPRADREVDA